MEVCGIWITLVALVAVAGVAEGEMVLTLTPSDPPPIALNTSVVFTCKGMGMDTEETDLHLKWQNERGEEIRELAGRIHIEIVSSQERKLYITRIKNTDAGEYTCIGFLEGNSVKRHVTLRIFKDITFEDAESPQDGVLNKDYVIRCKVSGQPAPTVSWKRSQHTIQSGGRFTLTNDGLRITRLTHADAGYYTCRAEVNDAGRVKLRDIQLLVNTPPQFTKDLAKKSTGTELQEASLVCKATGVPKPVYEFFRAGNDNPIAPNYEDRIFVNRDEGELAFRPVYEADKGMYRCEAYNTAGRINSTGELFVAVIPTVEKESLKNKTAREGQGTFLECVMRADPPAAMTFHKVGNPYPYDLGSNEKDRIRVTSTRDNTLTLSIDPLQPEDTANYTCMGTNQVGYGGKNGTIMVEFSPRFAADHMSQMYSWAGKKRNISCQAQGYPDPIMYWSHHGEQLDERNNNETYHLYVFTHGRSNLQVTIRAEDEDWIYGRYRCHARNDIDPPGTQFIELIQAVVPDPPANVVVNESMSSPTMVYFIITDPVDNGGQPVLRYDIAYDGRRIHFYKGDVRRIINLRGETEYSFYITAVSEVGESAAYRLAHKTANIRPPYPIEINSEHESGYPHEYTVRWEEPKDGGFRIRYYEFFWRQVTVKPGSMQFESELEDWNHQQFLDDLQNSMRWYKLQGLKSGAYYQVDVRAYNDRGTSEAHPDFIFKTYSTGRAGQVGDGASGVTITPHVIAASLIICLYHITLRP